MRSEITTTYLRAAKGRTAKGRAALLVALVVGACAQEQLPQPGPRVTRFRLSGQGHTPCVAPKDPGSILCSTPELTTFEANESVSEHGPWEGPVLRGSADPTAPLPLDRLLVQGRSSPAYQQRLLAAVERRALDDPENPEMLNDLAVARWFFAEKMDSPSSLPTALVEFERALSMEPSSSSVLFNRAVWLTAFGLRNPARETWRQLLDQEKDPGWREEASKALQSLDGPESSKLRAQLREHFRDPYPPIEVGVESHSLPQLLRELSQGLEIPSFLGSDSPTRVRAERLSRALEAVHGSPFFAHTLEAFQAAGMDERSTFVEAHRQFADGLEAFDRGDLEVAKARWLNIEPLLVRFHSPFRLRLQILLSILDYYEDRFERAYESLSALLASPELDPYPALQARCHWLMALCRGKQGDLLACSKHLSRSLDLYRTAREPGNEAVIRSLLAETTQELGQTRRAWRYRLQAMSRLHEVPDPRRRHNMLYETADAFLLEGLPILALPFLDQMVREAEQLPDPIYSIEARIWHSRALSRLQRLGAAGRTLTQLDGLLARLPEGELTDRLKADVEWIRGTAPSLPATQSARHLNTSEALYARSGDRTRLPDLLRDRAALHRRNGNVERAITDLFHGIEIFEDLRRDLPEKDLRISYFDRSRELFDDLVPLLVEAGEVRQALHYAERSKARVLKDLLGSERAPKPAEVERRIQDRTAVLFFFALEEELFLWILKTGTTQLVRLPVRHREISRLVNRLAALGESGGRPDPRFDEILAELSERVIAPVAAELRESDTVVVVPDKDLFRVPFDCLLKDGRYLFQDHRVAVVPSLSLWLEAKSSARRQAGPPKQLLAVAITDFDPDLELRPLPGARQEALDVSRTYADSVVLLDDQATVDAFRAGLEQAEVLHLATHAVVSSDYPLFSFLALASGPAATKPIYAHQLYDLPPSRLRLAVLAACRTGSGRISLTEGPHSLARPFLAQGVPNVLATLWSIEDSSSAEILPEFHRFLVSGLPPAEALRQTKIIFFGNSGSGSVQSIATFQMLGAD